MINGCDVFPAPGLPVIDVYLHDQGDTAAGGIDSDSDGGNVGVGVDQVEGSVAGGGGGEGDGGKLVCRRVLCR